MAVTVDIYVDLLWLAWLQYGCDLTYCLYYCSGYLYAHISYLQEDCPACLLLLSTDRNAFFELAGTKQKILEASQSIIDRLYNVSCVFVIVCCCYLWCFLQRLEKYKCLEAITEAVATRSYSTGNPD